MIKVLQERQVERKNFTKLIANLNDLRAEAVRQPGYITGETLFKGNNPIDVLVISTWLSEEDWKAWETSEERIEINDVINSMINGEAKVCIYYMAPGIK